MAKAAGHEIWRGGRRLRRRRRLGKTIGWLLVGLLTGAAAIAALRSEQLTFDSVVIEGNQAVPTEELLRAVGEVVGGNYFYLLPRQSLLFFPRRALGQRLLQEFLPLKEVHVKLKDLNTLLVRVVERPRKYLWCPPEFGQPGDCYFLDDRGLIFATAPLLTGSVFLTFIGPLPEVPLGAGPIPPEKFSQLIAFQSQVAQVFGEEISRVLVGEADDFVLQTAAGPAILFNLEQNLTTALVNLESALATPALKDLLENRPAALERIDLRFPPKVFYELKEAL